MSHSSLGQIMVASQQGGGGGIDFVQLKNQIDQYDEPDGTNQNDHSQLIGLYGTAKQAVDGQDPTAPAKVQALYTLRGRVALAVPVQQLAETLGQRLDQAYNRVPAPVRTAYGNRTMPAQTALNQPTQDARAHTGATNFTTLAQTLNGCVGPIAAFENSITQSQGPFNKITALWGQFAGTLNGTDTGMAAVARRFFETPSFRVTEWNPVISSAERAVIPSNRDMQDMQQQNAGTAAATVGQLLAAGLVAINTGGGTYYESSYDRELDHFGGSWGLTPTASSGSMQWIRAWEFHIHGAATRAGGLPGQGAATGFDVLAGHIKPTDVALTTGNSVTVTDQTTLNAFKAGAAQAFTRWAGSRVGQDTLARHRRS
jgi:hypothetical protein